MLGLKQSGGVIQMENKKTTENGNKLNQEFKVNLRYISFVNKIVSEKLQETNSKKLAEIYKNEVALKPTNIKRVSSRVLRKEIKSNVSAYLEEKYNMRYSDFVETSDKIVQKISSKNSGNYMKI